MMRLVGDDAAPFNAMRLDNFENVNKGPLVLVDDQTGEVAWTDKSSELKSITLGIHAIRIVKK